MKLIVTNSIGKTELKPLASTFPIEAVKAAAKKSLSGLGENIKNTKKLSSSTLSKVYLTSTGGAGRAVFLSQISEETSILVMIRLKNDKQVGANMTVKNPKFEKVLEKNLDLILSDLKAGNLKEYEI